MDDQKASRGMSRRDFLKFGGQGALIAVAGGALAAAGRRLAIARAAQGLASDLIASSESQIDPRIQALPPNRFLRLAATDGFMQLPGRGPLYVFGFVRVPMNATIDALDIYKGMVQVPAPIIAADEDGDHFVTLTNIGLVVRPDLDDSHTIHWHGFRNPNAVFDGVPEVSIAVPVARDFPYFYRPHDEGTYMYHCHFEDTEHVQMQMDGVVYVRPTMGSSFAYNDASTAFDREYALLLNEIDPNPHDLLENVQEFTWTDYKASYWIINGRSYPDTLAPNNDPGFPSQPLSSLIQCNPGERVLARIVNLGYEQQSMHAPGIRFRVVGEDATLLRGPAPGNQDLSYETNTLFIGPGEARDVLFTGPAFDSTADVASDSNGPYNTYLFKNRNSHRLTNGGAPGLGGQATEIRVYRDGLPVQNHPNETYPEFSPAAPYLDPWLI